MAATVAGTDLDSLLARHRAFWERTPVERPLLDVVRARPQPEIKYTQLTPEMLVPGAYVDATLLARRSASLVQGDFFRAVGPYSRVPWMEAIVGCPIRVEESGDAGMWPRPRPFEWSQVSSVRPAPDNPWLAKLLEYTRELVAAWDGTYLVCPTLMRGPVDMASAILGDIRMGLAFHDYPSELSALLAACADTIVQVAHAQADLIPPYHGGYCSLYGIWAPGRTHRVQTDSSSQLSPRTYREHILPHDRRVMGAFHYASMDLHSGGTFHLAEELLDVPSLKAISISIDPYESAPRISQLVPGFARILERKSLILNGPMKEAELRLLLDSLPPTGLAIRARIEE